MLPYYALALLLAGIVLLYLYMQTVEPFIQVPTLGNKKIELNAPAGSKQISIYLHHNGNNTNNISFKDSSDSIFTSKNVICTTNTCTINKSKYKLHDYAIYAYQQNCKVEVPQCDPPVITCKNKKTLMFNKTNKGDKGCYNLIDKGITVRSNNKDLSSNIVSSIYPSIKVKNKLPEEITKSLIISGLSKANISSIDPKFIDNNKANICIELSITEL